MRLPKINHVSPINPYIGYCYFTTAINIRTNIPQKMRDREKKYALIGLKNLANGRYKIHPVTEYIIMGRNINNGYLTMKKEADQIVPFLNYIFIQKYLDYRIRHLAELKFDHGSDFLNFKGLETSPSTIKRYERTLTNFYWFLSQKNLSENFRSTDFILRNISIKGKPVKYIESPFEGVIYPNKNLLPPLLHDLPDELLFHFIFEAQRISPLIAFGIYLQTFGGIRIGELVNLKKSSIKTIGPYGSDGFIVSIEQHLQKNDFYGSTYYDGVKVVRQQIVLPVHGLIDMLYKNHFEKYTASDGTNALFANRKGNSMTSGSYRYYFHKVKESFLKRLIGHKSHIIRNAGLFLRSERWNTHILRGKFSHLCVENCETPFEVMRARGDKHIDSVIDYLNNSPQIQKKMTEVINKLFNDTLTLH